MPQEEPALEVKPGESVYTMVSPEARVLTREEGWNEVKLGRVFKESDLLEVGGERGWIKHSLYEAYLGDSKVFTRRMEQKPDVYHCLKDKLIFITDGALWLRNWITDAYPLATQILDLPTGRQVGIMPPNTWANLQGNILKTWRQRTLG